ncbi:disulfide bond formation protein B [Pararhodobacter sp. CCB-MM2]|uniref:disulfide bond formation protein B n=1 Tax=Pararhodobacter sp. CCB-MM2 TaxID=1786003 RepID=UPI00082F1AAB|nr:disulfide bond formation protein B [Pararhodobacter sp. CCB-MM2]
MKREFSLATLAGLGSGALLAGALFFQYGMGLAPCQLCIEQRWPHLAALLIGILVFFVPNRLLMALGALAAATSGGLGIFHTGVERGWWEGPTACSGTADISTLSPSAALDAIMAAPVVRCTDVAWEMLGLSMASWNAIFSFALAALWIVAMRRKA